MRAVAQRGASPPPGSHSPNAPVASALRARRCVGEGDKRAPHRRRAAGRAAAAASPDAASAGGRLARPFVGASGTDELLAAAAVARRSATARGCARAPRRTACPRVGALAPRARPTRSLRARHELREQSLENLGVELEAPEQEARRSPLGRRRSRGATPGTIPRRSAATRGYYDPSPTRPPSATDGSRSLIAWHDVDAALPTTAATSPVGERQVRVDATTRRRRRGGRGRLRARHARSCVCASSLRARARTCVCDHRSPSVT